MVTWSLRARAADLSPGENVGDWSATLKERVNAPDTLQVEARAADLGGAGLLDAGAGVTVSDGDGRRRFSGSLAEYEVSSGGNATATFQSDLIALWSRRCYPTPTAAVTAQTTDYGHVLTGPRETVLLSLINLNAGPGALAARRVPRLTVPTSLGRGGTSDGTTARFDILGELVASLAEAGTLRVTVQQVGSNLAVVVTPMLNLTATARYGTPGYSGPGLIGDDWSYTVRRPDLTVAEVAGGGDGLGLTFRERTAAGALAAWGRIEGVVEQSQTTIWAELDQAGDAALAAGSSPVAITASLRDSPDLRLGTDVPLGSLVSLDLGGIRVQDRLRQLTTKISRTDSDSDVSVVGAVGSPDSNLTRDQREFLAMRRIAQREAVR